MTSAATAEQERANPPRGRAWRGKRSGWVSTVEIPKERRRTCTALVCRAALVGLAGYPRGASSPGCRA